MAVNVQILMEALRLQMRKLRNRKTCLMKN